MITIDTAKPSIVSQPIGTNVNAGANVTLTVDSAWLGKAGYQWSLDGIDVAGATNSTLALTNVQTNQAGIYLVAVTDDGQITTSCPHPVYVLVRPFFIAQPKSQTVVVGDEVTFSVTVGGNPPQFGYAWRKNGATVVPLSRGR